MTKGPTETVLHNAYIIKCIVERQRGSCFTPFLQEEPCPWIMPLHLNTRQKTRQTKCPRIVLRAMKYHVSPSHNNLLPSSQLKLESKSMQPSRQRPLNELQGFPMDLPYPPWRALSPFYSWIQGILRNQAKLALPPPLPQPVAPSPPGSDAACPQFP